MSAKLQIANTISTLQQRKASLCCEDVKDLLEKLGFEVRDGRKGGHKIYFHQGLPSFQSGSFNCGHGKNPEIKPAYISKIIQILKQYQDELEQYLE
jgi:predicted RNA binding protein YcfA (HicA-like mRNA interferase family)